MKRSGRLARFGVAAAAAAATAAVLAPSAPADFHVMKIKEITGDSGTGDGSYIELQMYEAGHNNVAGHNITIWNEFGVVAGMVQPIATLPLVGPNPLNGQSQRTILVGDTGVVGRDFTLDLTPYLATGSPANVADAGAACFEAIPVDCVSWGAGMGGSANLPDKTTPIPTALGVGVLSFRRNITGGTCATALDAADDTNNAGNDFTNGSSSPTPNAALPTEQLCVTPNPTTNSTPKAKAKKCKKKKGKGKGKAGAAAKKCKRKKKS